ncbi:MAG: hypothetical protein JWR87_3534 [Segetibacter sp.]|jgi:hypothetical protein|nr:hypothetical protein [Segetibacter sp.]
MLQSSEEEGVSYSETTTKRDLNSSLTYWKLKNKHTRNEYSLLRSSKLEEYTSH